MRTLLAALLGSVIVVAPLIGQQPGSGSPPKPGEAGTPASGDKPASGGKAKAGDKGQQGDKDQPGNKQKSADSKAKGKGSADKGATKPPAPPKDDPITAKDPAIVAIDKFRKAKANSRGTDWRTSLPAPPQLPFDPARDYHWHLETSVGTLVVTLAAQEAPIHCSSVVYLSRCGFYDGLHFPRVLKGFMAQGGSPTDTQSGNAGYTMDGEFAAGLKHDRPGTLSAANSNAPNTDGSQFFLTFAPAAHLDGKHTVHGHVTEGLDALQQIEARGVQNDGDPLPERVAIVRTWVTVTLKAPAAKPSGSPESPPKRDGK